MSFDRALYFDSVRASLFGGSLSQQQVDGMNHKLDVWEDHPYSDDLRWLAYCFGTSYHETAQKMWPIEEYGKGSGQSYGKVDPQTGQTYYGRGDVQLTWRDNYARATQKLGLTGDDDLEWHAGRALDPAISADIMFRGMAEGWFTGKKLPSYFNATTDDPFNARDIINPDKNHVIDGKSIGQMIKEYHQKFLDAVKKSYRAVPPEPAKQMLVALTVPPEWLDNCEVVVSINGEVT